MITLLPTLRTECANSELIRWIIWGLIFLIVVMGFFIIVMMKVSKSYENILVQNKVLQRDLELNTLIKHEYIQKLLCPHDLITFNDEHVYTVDKCSSCNKQCKRECWTQYYIDKARQEEGGN